MNSVWAPPIAATGALVLATLAWFAAEAVHDRSVVDADVRDTLARAGKVDVIVTLDFQPERFHAEFFRQLAPVGGRVRGQRFYLANLGESRLRAIGTRYWVSSVTRWDRQRGG